MIMQLYLHFPFCKRKCFYCDFCSAKASPAEMDLYTKLLEKEIKIAAEKYRNAKINTVFCGGGTPSIVPAESMERVWRAIHEHFCLLPNAEYTVEANPGTLRPDWLALASRYGVNRLSLGVQAVQPGHLRTLGRIHSFAEAKEAAQMAGQFGIKNLNIDIMFGLPGQSLAEYEETLTAVEALSPKHISAYGLILEEGTKLHTMVREKKIYMPEEDETARMYEAGVGWLAQKGYEQYEISNFAQAGYACRHNLGYWQGAWYLGLGLNAHSLLPSADGKSSYLRMENTEDHSLYRRQIEKGELPIQRITPISLAESMFESVMLGLRVTQGIKESDFCHRHGRSLESVYGKQMERLIGEKLGMWIEDESGSRAFALTQKGLMLQNPILLRFMPE